MILPARLDKCRRGRGSLTLALVGALRLENHFLKLALIELKFFLSLLIIIINHREETGLKRAVGSVWGSLMVHCLDRHTHIRLAGNKSYIIWKLHTKSLPILGHREMKVWHFPEQDCNIVMCHFSRLHYTKICCIITKNAVGFQDF